MLRSSPAAPCCRCVQSHRKRGTCLREEQLVSWLLQLTLALDYIHVRHSVPPPSPPRDRRPAYDSGARQVIHRDIKTQNIFLMRDRTVKLGDFGVSRVLDTPCELAKTCAGLRVEIAPA